MSTAPRSGNGADNQHRKTEAERPALGRFDSVEHVQRLIERALGDLRDARRRDHAPAARRAEQRMNALLELFARRTRASRRAPAFLASVRPGSPVSAAVRGFG